MRSNKNNYLLNIVSSYFVIILAAVLLFTGLGKAGLWEPLETKNIEIGENYNKNNATISNQQIKKITTSKKTITGTNLYLGERLSAIGWKLGSRTTFFARLPFALLAFFTLFIVFIGVRSLTNKKISNLAVLAFASSPALLFHGRQATGLMPLLCGETLAFLGLLLIAYKKDRFAILAGVVLTVVGLCLGWLSAGVLIGLVIPIATILATLALSGDLSIILDTTKQLSKSRLWLLYLSFPVLMLAVLAFVYAVYFANSDIALITGGLPIQAIKAVSFTFALEQIAFGWFPWSAIVPAILFGLLSKKDSGEYHHLKMFTVSAVSIGLLVQIYYMPIHGMRPLFLGLPMCLAASIISNEIQDSRKTQIFITSILTVFTIILIRDIAQNPEVILFGLGTTLKVPSNFNPVIPTMIASIPFGIMLLTTGFLSVQNKSKIKWLAMRTHMVAPFAAIAAGGLLTVVIVPELSKDLSSKYIIDAYKNFAIENEPLAVYGKNSNLSINNATSISNQAELLEWFSRKDRVFALISPKSFSKLNIQYRKKFDKHVFVLDAKSNKFFLTTNKPLSTEKNNNPIVNFVFSKPFSEKIAHKMTVNFDDRTTLLGWNLWSGSSANTLKKGKDFTLTTYWRCDDSLSKNYKFFVHIKGPGSQIKGDHVPVKDVYPTTMWTKGDYIKDVYKGTIPTFQKKGDYSIAIGLFSQKSRLKVKNYSKARENAILLGKVKLK